jgi:hypothetical protein
VGPKGVVKAHKMGTSFGNQLLNRYLKNVNHVKNSTTEEEMKSFRGESMICALDRPFQGDLRIRADSYQLIYDDLMRTIS